MPQVDLQAVAQVAHGYTFRQVECWIVARRDGKTYALTSNSQQVKVDGWTFRPTISLEFLDVENAPAVGQSNSGGRGSYSTEFVTYEDVLAGKWRGARITALVYDLRNLIVGPIGCSEYELGEVRPDKSGFEFEITSLGDRLGREIGDTWARNCKRQLGDPHTCQADVVPLSEYGQTVDLVLSRQRFRTSAAGSREDDWFQFGKVIFRSGANRGLERMVARYTDVDGEVTLTNGLPLPIEVDDEIDLIVGCNHLVTHCGPKFGNLPRFGGQPDIPGPDDQGSSPDQEVA